MPRERVLHLGALVGVAAASLAHSHQLHAEEGVPVRKPVDECGFWHTVVRGVPHPGFSREDVLAELQRDFALGGTDIVIATYPKCGTTWMQQIVLTLLYGGDRTKVPAPMEQAPWIEATTCCKANTTNGQANTTHGQAMSVPELNAWDGSTHHAPAPPRRVFKTHAPVELLPWRGGVGGLGGAKVVVVVRNPRDACVSGYHHARDSTNFRYRGHLEHFTSNIFLKKRFEHGDFWEWHAGWERLAKEQNGILWVAYEELKRDPVATIRRIAHFLEVPATEEQIADTAASSSFQAMKASFAVQDSKKEERGAPVKKNHIRQGEMGAWRRDIDGALLVEFDAVERLRVASTGLVYEFDYGDEP